MTNEKTFDVLHKMEKCYLLHILTDIAKYNFKQFKKKKIFSVDSCEIVIIE